MKRKATTIVLVLSILSMSLMGCKKEEPLTKENFNTIMETSGYNLIDITENISQELTDDVEVLAMPTTAIIAQKDDYQIEYYEFSNNDYAIEVYEANKDYFSEYKTTSDSYTEEDTSSYSIYTLTTDAAYCIVSRIDNQLIYTIALVNNKDEIDEIFKTLGVK